MVSGQNTSACVLRVCSFVIGLLLGLSVVCTWSTAWAQAPYGGLVGQVSDQTGAAIRGASVTLTNLNRGETRTASADSTGMYRFVQLAPGRYRLQVEQQGFKSFSQAPLDITVNTTLFLATSLALGDLQENVLVQGNSPLIEASTGSIGQVIEGRQVQQMPLNGRNTMNLLALVPGVVPLGGTQGSAAGNYTGEGQVTNVVGFGNYQIGGGLGGQEAVFFDGAPLNRSSSNATVLIPAQDDVQEFRVTTSVPGPQFGAFSGGVVSFYSRSGSNGFHGSAYEYFRNTVLDANNFFNNLAGIARPQLNQNQFGGTFSGPIKKDKLFFFSNYERFTRRNGIPFTGRTPTPAELNGDFRADPPIYDPLTRAQFQCNGVLNVICPNRIDPTSNVMANVLHYWPTPNADLAGGAINYIANAKAGADTNQFNQRIDYIVSAKQSVFARYTYWNIDTLPTQYIFDSTGGPTSLPKSLVTDQQFVIGDTYSFNAHTVGDLRVSYLRALTPFTAANNNVNLSQFGPAWAALSSSLTHQQFPDPIIVGTLEFPYAGLNVTDTDAANDYAISASLSKVMGAHALQFGADLRQYDFRRSLLTAGSGELLFAGVFTSGPRSPAGSGATPIADFVLGDITPSPGASVFQTAINAHARQYYQGYYVNDTYQLGRRLTINAGVRWEIPGSYTEEDGRNTVLLPKLQNPLVLVGSPQHPSGADLENHYHLFAPRMGMAYRLTYQTVVSAGYGINFLPQGVGVAGPWYSPVNNATTDIPLGGTVSNPLLGGPVLQPIGRSSDVDTAYLGQSIESRIPNQAFPYVQQWNLNIQRGIGSDAVLKLAYAGSRGEHLPLGVPAQEIGTIGADINQLSPSYYYLGPALLQKTPNGETLGQTLRPYPEYQTVGADSDFAGDSYYNSFEATFQQRLRFGASILAGYTWSKLITDTEGDFPFFELNTNGVGAIQDYTNLRAERSLSSSDVPNRFVVSYVLDLPFGQGRRFDSQSHFVDQLISGWTASGITTYQSGMPLGIVSAAPNALSTYFGAGTIRPNVSPGCNKSVAGSLVNNVAAGNSVINADCFSPPGEFSFGDESRLDPTLRAEGIENWDFSLGKTTKISEKLSFNFGAEFFNLFNQVQFAPPNTSFGNPLFGKVTTQASNPREVQLTARMFF